MTSSQENIVVVALYHFVRLDDFESLRDPLLKLTQAHDIKGTLLLAHEGINGTISGTREGIDAVLDWLKKDDRFAHLEHKESFHIDQPFHRIKVKLKKEIVTMGVENIDPNEIVGTYVEPKDWNNLISDPGVTVIDTRNKYEIMIGKFKNAINPQTDTFREFPAFVDRELDPENNKRVAMYCTGGIRCEKSTAYLKQKGFKDVYHLQGGILKYLEEVPQEQSLWDGECFVFDTRVAVDHELNKGKYDQCYACRFPITEEEKQSPHYMKGVSCERCYDKYSEAQKASFQERQKQVNLSAARGEKHLGVNPRTANKD